MKYSFNIDVENYKYEMAASVFMVFCFVFLFYGSAKNDLIAKTWKRSISEAIAVNFAHFGFEKEPSIDLLKVSYNEYQYFASGRANCYYTLMKLELQKRQCLFTTLIMDMIWPA